MDLYFKAESSFKYLSGYTTFSENIGILSTSNFAANYVNGIPVYIENDVIIESLSFRVNSSVVGNAVLGVYKYRENTNDWELVDQTLGTIDASVTGVQELFFASTLNLKKGIYCFAGNSNAIISTSTYSVSSLKNIFGNISTGLADYNIVQYAYTYTGTLPSIIPFSVISFGPKLAWVIAAKIS